MIKDEMPDEIYAYKEECKIATGLYRTDLLWREKKPDGDKDIVKYTRADKCQALQAENKAMRGVLESSLAAIKKCDSFTLNQYVKMEIKQIISKINKSIGAAMPEISNAEDNNEH